MTSTASSSSAARALVTGASSGIGREIARELARAGHPLVLTARRADALEALAGELRRTHGVEVQVLPADLAAADGADRLVADLQARQLDIGVLVNNAGFGVFGRHLDNEPAAEDEMLQVNIRSLTRLTRWLLPAMVHAGAGRVLNVASTASFQPGPYMAVYYATKAYVLSYSEALAEELRGTGVTVTALCPGPTASGFQDKAAMHDSALVHDRRLPTAAEVAAFGVRAMRGGRRVAVPGWRNRLLAFSVRLTPRAWVTRLVAHMSRPVSA